MFWKRCKHEWEVLDKTVLPSGFEQITTNLKPKSLRSSDKNLYRKKLILTVKCRHCPALRQFVEENP